jgi:hypothetical protein
LNDIKSYQNDNCVTLDVLFVLIDFPRDHFQSLYAVLFNRMRRATRASRRATAAAIFCAAFFSLLEGVNGCVADCQTFGGGFYFTCLLNDASSDNGKCNCVHFD